MSGPKELKNKCRNTDQFGEKKTEVNAEFAFLQNVSITFIVVVIDNDR